MASGNNREVWHEVSQLWRNRQVSEVGHIMLSLQLATIAHGFEYVPAGASDQQTNLLGHAFGACFRSGLLRIL
jgi:hypothetical protein